MTSSTPDHFNHQKTIFDLTPFPMWIFDLETFRFLAVNKEAIRHYGYSEDEFLKMTIKDIRPQEDIPKLEKAVYKARKRTDIYKESLFRHQKRDGSIIYVQIKSNLIDFKGKKAEIVTAIDLTDQYEHQHKIEVQKEYLKAIGAISQLLLKSTEWTQALDECFKIVGDTIHVDRIYLFQNNRLEQTTSQKIEWSREHIIPQFDNPEFQELPLSGFPLFMEPLKNKKPFEAIVDDLPSSPTKEKLEQLEVKSILVLPLWIKDAFYGFIGFEDCTHQRKFSDDELQLLYSLVFNLGHVIKEYEAYRELSLSEARFKSLIQNSKDLIAVIDEKGTYKYVAPASKTVLGVSPEEFLGKNAFDYIYIEDLPRIKEQFKKLLETKYFSSEPYRFPDANGNMRWVKTDLSNHLKTQYIEGIVTNTHDVTEEVKKRQVDELRTSLTQAIGQPGTLSSCLDKALSILANLNKIDLSEIWLLSEDGTRLNIHSNVCQDKHFNVFYKNSNKATSLAKGVGLPGYTWNENRTVVLKNIGNNKIFSRSKAAAMAKLNTGIGLPLNYNNEFLGCIICLSQNHEKEILDEVNLLSEVSQHLGAVVKQKITEAEYRNFFDISPDPHCLIGFDGYIKKFNKAFAELLGYKEEKLLSTPIFQFIHEEDLLDAQKRIQASMGGAAPSSFEARFKTKSGDIRWLIWTGTKIVESKVFVAVAKDITEQKSAEQELLLAYERLRSAQKIAKLGYWVREIDSDKYIWSDEMYKIYDRSAKTFIPTLESVTKILHPEDRYLIEDGPLKRLQPGKIKSFEHRIISSRGKVKWLHQEIKLITDKNNVPLQIEGTSQDITERKEHEEQLSISNERFKLAMLASNEIIWEVDHQNKKVIRGKGYGKSFNYDTSEDFSITNSLFSKIHPEDRDMVWKSLNQALKNKKRKSWKAEYKVQSENGSFAYFIDRCHILRDKTGKAIRTVGSTLDVTTSRRQLERIKEQNKNLREIGWLQSHVIRAPLSRIMGLVHLSNKLEDVGKSREEMMQMITDAANELDKVIHDIVDKTNLIQDEDSRISDNQ